MKQYIIDLSSFPKDERKQILKILEDYAYITQIIPSKPDTFKVFWNYSQPINETLKISLEYITLLQ